MAKDKYGFGSNRGYHHTPETKEKYRLREERLRPFKRKELPVEVLKQDYLVSEMSIDNIAKAHGWSKSNVRSKMIDYGILLRTQKEGCNTNAHIEMLSKRKPHLGIPHTDETKNRIREIKIIQCSSQSWREEQSKRLKLAHIKHPEYRVRASLAHKGKHLSEKHKAKISLATKGRVVSKETRIKLSLVNKGQVSWILGKHVAEETKLKISKSHKILWANPAFRDKTIKALIKASHVRPTKPEIILANILDVLYPEQWKYTGDGSLIIKGKNPDFANVNGKKQLIEMYGDYYHKDDNPQDRIDYFKEYGFDTLIIWEHELKDKELIIEKIKAFTDG